ncbi:MAG: type III pantothenate kinase [Alphaproteobacteria bacterium GM202ARS2]|nr:type III pantothenate kinase [Alphaproteobacteria bacterium GM202ARS2]
MFLAIDIGNSETVCALCRGTTIIAQWRWQTVESRSGDEYGALIGGLLTSHGHKLKEIKGVILANVVPLSEGPMVDFCQRYLSVSPLVVSARMKGLPELVLPRPEQAGGDRLANAVALQRDQGGASMAVDLGTATTFDVVDKHGRYIGGAIAPGFAVSMASLAQKAARLNEVSFQRETIALIGDTTEDALRSGLYWGYVSMLEGMIARFRQQQKSLKVVACGGAAVMFAQQKGLFDEYLPTLTLKGLAYLYQDNAP